MKKIFLLFFTINLTFVALAQTELKATMGINFISLPSVDDYINQNYAPPDDQLGSFKTAAIFTGEVGYFFSQSFEVSIEIPYQIYSYTTSIAGNGQYDLYYDELLPSLMAYYVLAGTGYNFKFGGGVGPRFVFVTEDKKWQGTSEEFNSTGFGGVLRIEGNTSLAENVYANIGFDLRYDFSGEPENDNGNKLYNNVEDSNVNFNSFSAGIKLGISYMIGGSN